ncbi:AI-2E family transporter [Haloimpatiens sp. FM7315]|uniref:AI-2E family transporter n=1 Tax=Haloimpatiens sp. FM7315 TaxID=3298609 RepID=UPI0035A29F15
MKLNKYIVPLITINLFLLACHFLIDFSIVKKAYSSIHNLVIVPIFISIFVYYLLKPLNNIFQKKGLKKNFSSALTLIIATIIVLGFIEGLSYYFIEQVNQLITKLNTIKEGSKYSSLLQGRIFEFIDEKLLLDKFFSGIKNYVALSKKAIKTVNHLMGLFSDILLIIIIVFYLLKDKDKLTKSIVNLIPKKYNAKYKDKLQKVIDKSDYVLSNYVIGQAKVAFSLSSMLFVGYLIIGMPTGLILASITFILAFIPFVGFFISMIIPYIIALSMGFKMVAKLSLLFIIAQTLKGRVVVPLVMSKAMKIHPITDIFLVITAAGIFGPLGAFVIVPVYSVLKIVFTEFYEED